MSDMIIKSDYEPKRKKVTNSKCSESDASSVDLLGFDGMIAHSHRIHESTNLKSSKSKSQSNHLIKTKNESGDQGEEKVIETFDPKAIKLNIVKNWQAYIECPQKIVKTIRRLYTNTATASSQLSNLKSVLSQLSPAPPDDFLNALKLSAKEYKSLHEAYREKRDKEGKDLRTINDSDKLVQSALEMITSSDFRVLWPAVIVCSGLRPIEVLTCKIKESPEAKHVQDAFWVCVSNWAKKGDPRVGRDMCMDHPLLCPSYLWVRAVKIIRAYFCKEPLTKREYSQRYSKYWLQLLRKGFPNLIKPDHVLFRRFYAKYSFLYFKNDFENVIGENSYISHVLGHTSTEPALSYTNLGIRGAGKINLFDIGRQLQVPLASTRLVQDKRKRPREHVKLDQRKV